jgi:hypothetical protein
MAVDTVSIGLSGIAAGITRQCNSAHNVANSLTDDFHNLRTHQVDQPGGGTRAVTTVDAEPRPVSYAREVIEQKLAEVQILSSARVLKTSLDLRGSLLDIFA